MGEIKAGDLVINKKFPNRKPTLVEEFSESNTTLGIRNDGWFKWLPLNKNHIKWEK